MKNLVFQNMGSLLIAVYNENQPTDDDHRKATAVFRTLDLEKVRFLGVTRGGAPTASQRKDLTDILNGRELLAAIVTDARLVRGVVSALSWFNQRVRAFSMSEMDEAFKYLSIVPRDFEHVRSTVKRLEGEVAGAPGSAGRAASSR
jgi:hypothetical protein